MVFQMQNGFQTRVLICKCLVTVFKKYLQPYKLCQFIKSSSSEDMQAAVIYNITWQMKQNRKIGALKSFQGYMWKSGYETGDLKGMYVLRCKLC